MIDVIEVIKVTSPDHPDHLDDLDNLEVYSTVTDFARFRGWSTFAPRFTAI